LESRFWNAIEIIRGDLSKVEESEREIEKRLSVEITKMHHLIENYILKIEFTTFQTETRTSLNGLALKISRKIKHIESDFRSMADGRVSTLESEFHESDGRMTEIMLKLTQTKDQFEKCQSELVVNLSSDISQLQNNISELQKQFRDSRNANSSLRDKVTAIQDEIARHIKTGIRRVEDKCNSLETTEQKLGSDLIKQSENVTGLAKQFDTYKKIMVIMIAIIFFVIAAICQ
jgi:cell division protein ZapA (FtsZ GTPase activity inhibitor)